MGRGINTAVYPESGFRERCWGREEVLLRVLEGSKIFLIGDADELGEMAGKGLAEATSGSAG
ncbi:MAG: hypothetical protein N2512_07625 [Armatimonadetes bacterium]|nr:hypothetical protein [Armatimonadota bacterium]